MDRRKRILRHAILIICEGESTEPSYFKAVLEESRAEYPQGLVYEIQPKPRDISEETRHTGNPHKSARKKRNLIVPGRERETAVEDDYRGMPTRFVRAAQLGLEDGTFDQALAIFDQDGHARLKAAFDLAENAIDGRKVEVGFSSISFEHWVLLHFQYSDKAFQKSECKNEHGRYLGCGSEVHIADCRGEICVSGHMRMQNQYSYKKNHEGMWADLRPKLLTACRNATWLRARHQALNPGKMLYELNPVTTIDRAIQAILKKLPEMICIGLAEPLVLGQMEYTLNSSSPTSLSLRIKNLGTAAKFFKTEDFWIENGLRMTSNAEAGKEIIEPGRSSEWNFPVAKEFLSETVFLTLVGSGFELLFSLSESHGMKL